MGKLGMHPGETVVKPSGLQRATSTRIAKVAQMDNIYYIEHTVAQGMSWS